MDTFLIQWEVTIKADNAMQAASIAREKLSTETIVLSVISTKETVEVVCLQKPKE